MSTDTQSPKKFYYGWWIVFICFVMLTLVYVPMFVVAGQFVMPIAQEFGISMAEATTAISIYSFMGMVGVIFSGKLLTKYSTRVLVPMCAGLVGISFFIFSIAQNMMIMYVTAFFMGLINAGCTIVATNVMVNGWFGPKMRGKAVGIAMLGRGIGGLIWAPIVGWIIANWGWRVCYQIFAACVLVILVPLGFILIRRLPADKGLMKLGELDEPKPASATAPASAGGLTGAQTLRSNIFWIASAGLFFLSTAFTTFSSGAASFFQINLQFDSVITGSIMGLSSFGAIFGGLILGGMCDKMGTLKATMIWYVIALVSFICLLLTPTIRPLSWAASLIFGLGNAASTVPLSLIAIDLFGLKEYGTVIGFITIGGGLATAVGPAMTNLIFDGTGSYMIAWIVAAVMMVVSGLLISIAYKAKKRAYEKLGVPM